MADGADAADSGGIGFTPPLFHPCHPWLVNPVHERGWTTDLTDGHGSEARELSADDAADRKGLEVKRLRTFEGMPKPRMDWVVQLPHLRFSDLPVLG